MNAMSRYFQSMRFPIASRLGFIRTSLGIASRRRRFAKNWATHLHRSAEIQRRWSESFDDRRIDSLMVLGAGRLHDFNPNCFLTNCRNIHFVDADPLADKVWRRYAKRHPEISVTSDILDLTGVLAEWKENLDKFATAKTCSLNSFLDVISNWEVSESDIGKVALAKDSADAVLSLNLLGQLPLMWQDLVFERLYKLFGKKSIDAKQAEIVDRLSNTFSSFVRSHFLLLEKLSPKYILLLTDVSYYFHDANLAKKGVVLDWRVAKEQSETICEGRLVVDSVKHRTMDMEIEEMDSLYSVDVFKRPNLSTLLPHYQLSFSDTWLWEIAPQNETETSQGTTHRVLALALERR